MAKSKKYYVVWEGNETGIFDNWSKCQLAVKGYPNAKYKSFKSLTEAESAYHGNFQDHIASGLHAKPKVNTMPDALRNEVNWDSIAVDAACSGNPGLMEYQGVDTASGQNWFHQGPFKGGTNNVGEFLALVHGLAWLQQQGKTEMPIYSDSRIAMGWVKKKHCKTTLKLNPTTKILFTLIERAEKWLKTNTYKNPILKWETKKWGEIPADFGRK